MVNPFPTDVAIHNADMAAFNLAHKTGRVSIEDLFGIVKNRFPVLRTGLHFDIPKCCIVIEVLFALHNFFLQSGEDLEPW